MPIDLLRLIGEGGSLVLLAGVLLWLIPYKDKRTAETIQRVHQEDHAKLEGRVEQLIDAVGEMRGGLNNMARAVLIGSLIDHGRSALEAEAEAKRIILNGSAK